MPSERGKRGHRAQRRALAIIGGLTSLVLWPLTGRPEVLVLPIGVLLGKYLNPDQDAWNKVGSLEGILLLDTYREILPHRAKASHTIGISPLILFGPVAIPLIILAWALGIIDQKWFWLGLFWLGVGLVIDNTAHIVSDRVSSGWKKHVQGKSSRRSRRGA